MSKAFQTNKRFSAKATVTFATCIFFALAAMTRADDKDKQENPALQAPAKGGGAELQPSPSTPSVNSSLDSDKTSTSTSTSSSQGAPGSGSATASGKLSRGDEKFVRDAAKGGLMEVHMGQLGVQKGQSAEVKQYGQRLIDDHTKANAELKQLASQKGIALPDNKVASTDSERTKVRESEATTDHSEHGNMKHLETLSGTEFDREFVRMAVTDHQKDVKEFERAAQKADDSDIKAWAQKTAPTLREHLQQAKSLQAQVGGTTGGSQK